MSKVFVLGLALFAAANEAASPQLSNRDFEQLMEAAVTASAKPEVQPLTTTICVQQEFEPPIVIGEWIGNFLSARTPSALADGSLATAISSKSVIARQTSMPPLTSKFIIVSAKTKRPASCVIEHVPTQTSRPKNGNDSAVVLSFSQPVLANGYAFIEELEECPGLCATTYLRVFRWQKGKWVQAAETPMSVS
jgi:hypothetical protein